VQEFKARAASAPTYPANRCSNSLVFGPVVINTSMFTDLSINASSNAEKAEVTFLGVNSFS